MVFDLLTVFGVPTKEGLLSFCNKEISLKFCRTNTLSQYNTGTGTYFINKSIVRKV